MDAVWLLMSLWHIYTPVPLCGLECAAMHKISLWNSQQIDSTATGELCGVYCVQFEKTWTCYNRKALFDYVGQASQNIPSDGLMTSAMPYTVLNKTSCNYYHTSPRKSSLTLNFCESFIMVYTKCCEMTTFSSTSDGNLVKMKTITFKWRAESGRIIWGCQWQTRLSTEACTHFLL